jgi:hypothetical protein
MAVNGRNKGNTYERSLAQLFRELGFTCTTSRYSSKELDDKKVDLCGLPINVQAKAVERLGCMHRVLAEMPVDEKVNVVFHKKNRKGTICCLTEKDFLKIFKLLKDNNLIENLNSI